MLVKRSKLEPIIDLVLIAFALYVIWCWLTISKLGALIWAVIFTPLIIHLTVLILYGLQKYEYSEKGCTIHLLWRKRFYSWDQISSRYLDDFTGTYFRFHQYEFNEGIFFSIHPYKRPKWLAIEPYCVFSHPFTNFYVLFPTRRMLEFEKERKDLELLTPNLADREKFLSLLDSWGVTLTDVREIDVRKMK
jgi:hypothetical protein